MFKSYWFSLRFIANDVSLLFRNFLHWNLSKIAIFVVTMLTAIVVSLPLILIGFWMVGGIVQGLGAEGISDLLSSGVLPESVVTSLISNYWLMGGIALLFVLILTVFTVFMTYGYYLTTRVCQSYIDGNRLSIFRNDYLSIQHIWKFTGVLSWSSLYLLAPLFLGLVGMGILMYLTTGSGILTNNFAIGFILGLLGASFVVYFTYVAVRILFAYVNLLDQDALRTPALELVRRSIRLASGKVLRIVGLIIPFAVVIAMVAVGIQEIQQARDLGALESRAKTAATANVNEFINDHAFIQRDYILGYRLDAMEKQDVIAINNAYQPRTDGADPEYLNAIYPYIVQSGTMSEPMDLAWQIGAAILSFLLLEGVMIMVYLSIFHILKNEEQPEMGSEKKVVKMEAPEVQTEKMAVKSTAKVPAKKPATTKKTPSSKEKVSPKEKEATKKPVKKPTVKKPTVKK